MNTKLRDRLLAWKREGAALNSSQDRHREELRGIVEEAREEGVAVAAVAEELGVSRQSLYERLGRTEK